LNGKMAAPTCRSVNEDLLPASQPLSEKAPERP
jgi:hypothetical protein